MRKRPARPAPCPLCGAPTSLEGRFCHGCGWDADAADPEDAYLDGVDLPQGYAPDDPAEEKERFPGRVGGVVLVLVLLLGMLIALVPAL